MKVGFRTTLDSELLDRLKKDAFQKGKHVNDILEDLIESYLDEKVSDDEMRKIHKLRAEMNALSKSRRIETSMHYVSENLTRSFWELGYKPDFNNYNIFDCFSLALSKFVEENSEKIQ